MTLSCFKCHSSIERTLYRPNALCTSCTLERNAERKRIGAGLKDLPCADCGKPQHREIAVIKAVCDRCQADNKRRLNLKYSRLRAERRKLAIQ